MAQFARPSADILAGSWGAAPLFSKIDEEVPYDPDSISTAVLPNTECRIRLSSIDDPTIYTPVTFRARFRLFSFGSGSAYLRVKLYSGISSPTLIKNFTLVNPSGTEEYATISLTLSEAEAESISDWSELWVALDVSIYSQPSDSLNVSWLELEAPLVPTFASASNNAVHPQTGSPTQRGIPVVGVATSSGEHLQTGSAAERAIVTTASSTNSGIHSQTGSLARRGLSSLATSKDVHPQTGSPARIGIQTTHAASSIGIHRQTGVSTRSFESDEPNASSIGYHPQTGSPARVHTVTSASATNIGVHPQYGEDANYLYPAHSASSIGIHPQTGADARGDLTISEILMSIRISEHTKLTVKS